MQVIVSARNVEISDSLRRFIDTAFPRLTRFEPRIQRVEVTLLEEKTRRVVEALLAVDRVAPIHAHAEADEFRTAVDQVLAKLTRQLKKEHSRRVDHKAVGRQSRPEMEETA